MADFKMLFAGFGGQGILFAGKVTAYAGLCDEFEVSWLPSYGPEMRGGTANCSVCISSETISSPLVINPSTFVAMNQPSYDKFIKNAENGAVVVVDSTLVKPENKREDITLIEIPATALAEENGLRGLANIIILGKVYEITKFCSFRALEEGIDHCVPSSKKQLIESNMRAIKIGMEF